MQRERYAVETLVIDGLVDLQRERLATLDRRRCSRRSAVWPAGRRALATFHCIARVGRGRREEVEVSLGRLWQREQGNSEEQHGRAHRNLRKSKRSANSS